MPSRTRFIRRGDSGAKSRKSSGRVMLLDSSSNATTGLPSNMGTSGMYSRVTVNAATSWSLSFLKVIVGEGGEVLQPEDDHAGHRFGSL